MNLKEIFYLGPSMFYILFTESDEIIKTEIHSDCRKHQE